MEELYLEDYVLNEYGSYSVELSNGKSVMVSKKDIDNFVTKGKMTEIDAIELWLSDNGYLDSEEQNQLDEVAKKVKIDHKASADKPKKKEQKPRVIKVSNEKQELFNRIYQNLSQIYGKNAKIVKENKLITVNIGGKTFKLDLIEQRPPKK